VAVPLAYRVTLQPVDEGSNAHEALAGKQGAKSSKPAGEPGLAPGPSADFAIKRAVIDARREFTGQDDWPFRPPASASGRIAVSRPSPIPSIDPTEPALGR
jgi:hypothetical protein